MNDTKVTREDTWKSSLEDCIALAEKLEPFCKTVDELLGVLRAGVENDAQLRLLMHVTTTRK